MSTSGAFQELRRANPRSEPSFARSVQDAESLRRHIIRSPVAEPSRARGTRPPTRRPVLRGRTGLRTAAATLAVAGAVTAFLTVAGLTGGGVENASAAVKGAVVATASSARDSGTVDVVITYNGEPWAAKTVRWNGGDLAVVDRFLVRPGGSEFLVVDGMMYGQDIDATWVELGSPESIDPDSGTTPDEYLAATRADVTGDTLRSITDGMTGLTTRQLEDGSTVYRGAVRAGLLAPEAGFKEGEHIRVFPWGYVAHDEAADPAALLDAAVTVDADGLIRELAVDWGSDGSAWTYTVSYRDLGTTQSIDAPENAEPFPRRTPVPPTGRGSTHGD